MAEESRVPTAPIAHPSDRRDRLSSPASFSYVFCSFSLFLRLFASSPFFFLSARRRLSNTILGVDLAGNKEVLALRACAEEDKDGWACLLQDLRSRGATHIDLIVTDGQDGLLAAVAQLFAATPRQRCLVHKQRNVLNAVPRRERGEVQ